VGVFWGSSLLLYLQTRSFVCLNYLRKIRVSRYETPAESLSSYVVYLTVFTIALVAPNSPRH